MTIDLRYYLAVFFRRFPYFLLAFATIFALALTAAFKLPPAYESSAQLLMESAQIADPLTAANAATPDSEQLQIIQQRLMTRENMLDIARKLRVFAKIDRMSPDDIVNAMRDYTTIKRQAGRDQATLMTITFQAETAKTAAAVVNEYVTRILNDSASARTSQAQDTLQFFKQEVDRLSRDLGTQSALIKSFQGEHVNALPDTLNYRLSQQASLQERLSLAERDSASLKEQKQRLQEIFAATGQVTNTPGSNAPPEVQRLAALKSDLSAALAVYSPENPKVKLLQSQIAQLEDLIKTQNIGVGGTGQSAPASMFDLQLAELDTRISALAKESDAITAQLAQIKTSIDETAANAVTLQGLQRDYDNIQLQYNAATDRLAKASTAERITSLSKGERIAIIDSATVPDRPTKPNRLKIVVVGLVGGIAIGIGIIVLLELVNSAVQRPVDLVQKLGIIPIGTIPYIRTPGEKLQRRIAIGGLLAVVVLGLPTLLFLLDTYYQPLDLILARINAKIGL